MDEYEDEYDEEEWTCRISSWSAKAGPLFSIF
jgi:hypothetical protein